MLQGSWADGVWWPDLRAADRGRLRREHEEARAQEQEVQDQPAARREDGELPQVILASGWSTSRNTHLWLVNWPQYSPLVGQLVAILTSDWSTSRNTHLWLVNRDLWLVNRPQYSPLIGQQAAILTSDWLTGRNTHLWLVHRERSNERILAPWSWRVSMTTPSFTGHVTLDTSWSETFYTFFVHFYSF